MLSVFLACNLCYAQQDLPTISPDRPGALTGTGVMPLHKLQGETGMGFEHSAGDSHTFTLNNTLLRFGLFENAELRIGTDLLLSGDAHTNEKTLSLAPLTIGTKIKIYEGKGLIPSVSALAEFTSPHIGTPALRPPHLAPSFHLLLEHSINGWLDFCYNAGTEWDGESATPGIFLGAGAYFSITEHFGTYLESYNSLHSQYGNQNMAQFGFTYLVNHRLQLDFSADFDLRNLGGFLVVSSGLAWLIN